MDMGSEGAGVNMTTYTQLCDCHIKPGHLSATSLPFPTAMQKHVAMLGGPSGQGNVG